MARRTRPAARPAEGGLTHIDQRGQARMVDVGGKPETLREAKASGEVRMSKETLALVVRGMGGARPSAAAQRRLAGKDEEPRSSGKGDVLAVARIAALQGMKQTATLIPLCHPVRLVGSEVELSLDASLPGVRILVTARAFDRTGVEMEAMTGASIAALTIYDMVKAHERGVEISRIRLDEKSGGKSGLWRRADAAKAASSASPPGAGPPKGS